MNKPDRVPPTRVPSKHRRDGNLLKVTLLACIVVVKSSLAIGACAPAPAMTQSSTIQDSFWGMHIAAPGYLPWPNVSFGTVRTMDGWPGISWDQMNPADGVYDWSNFDSYVNIVASHGKDMVFTFNKPPSWAAYPSATNLGPWTKFVKAIVAKYCNVIKYWEIWNEPNSTIAWTGSTDDMVALAKVAYPIIHEAGGLVVSPGPQGPNAYKWLQDYFAKGGNTVTDIVAFHGYLYGPPEGIIPLTTNVMSTMATYGLSNAPVWDTEHSWGGVTWPYGDTPENQSRWLARFKILEASLGIDRSYWYIWDGFEYGVLNDRIAHTLLLPGNVYQEIYNWLFGNSVTCSQSGNMYACSIGTSKAVYWMSSGTKTISVDRKFKKTRDIFGVDRAIKARRITLSETPLLLQ